MQEDAILSVIAVGALVTAIVVILAPAIAARFLGRRTREPE